MTVNGLYHISQHASQDDVAGQGIHLTYCIFFLAHSHFVSLSCHVCFRHDGYILVVTCTQ